MQSIYQLEDLLNMIEANSRNLFLFIIKIKVAVYIFKY